MKCLAIALPLLYGTVCLADDYSLDTQPTNLDLTSATVRAVEPDSPPTETRKPFGTGGTSFVSVGGGAAYTSKTGDTSTDINAYLAWNYFLVDNVEFSLEAGFWAFIQTGPNQVGGSGTLCFRWHFVNKQTWSIFAEAGIGLMGASGEVPTGGTSFDFMPRAGVGFTYELSPGGARLQAGVRWFHISNARIEGDSNNPARDGVMGFVGVMFPLN